MEIIPFENQKVTTMTIIVSLNNPVNFKMLHHVIPIASPNDMSQFNMDVIKKNKLPHHKIPGTIIKSIPDNIDIPPRGFILNSSKSNKTKKRFKHVTTLYMSLINKNVSIKVASKKLHISGALSKYDGEIVFNYFNTMIQNVQNILDKINKGSCEKELKWIDDKMPFYNTKIPNDLDQNIIKFFLSMKDDFTDHKLFMSKLDFIISNKIQLYTDPIGIEDVCDVMINYNYSVGFRINRFLLNKYIDGKNGFISRYNNEFTYGVTIELPILGSSINNRKKNKTYCHTFLCYISGRITQSSSESATRKDAYELFMNTIMELRPLIEYKE